MTPAPSSWVALDVDSEITPAAAALAYAYSGLAVLPLHHPTGRSEWACSCQDVACRNFGKHPPAGTD